MDAAGTAAWGGVAALCFLVLAVPYHALAPNAPSVGVLVAVAIAVGLVGAAGARAVRD
ncbi:hypothetical protein MBEHAL_2147 [Halarchaeum acidiphilum MH1-52-1]|uniref:Uncharacterized protein n=1 Tax=Halarchaeum acidiphilum MH1-52-1 TaxID=1261545 RepID=U2YX88_9EURY|nr:hypothetical protein [Halarchaeum acidiphilum]GAD53387.1 hypothetical protein MBEHAL_2147 [Halarchaeum acidiphilum MH1-52-1]